MSRVECPSQAWDRHSAGEEDAADAAMALEKEVMEEAGYPNIEDLLDIWTKEFALDTLEGLLSDVISSAYGKGYKQASKDRADGQAEYEFEMEMQRTGKEYRVVCFMKIDAEEFEGEPMSYEEAQADIENQGYMQPEHIFQIEEVENAVPE